ncbi:MBL fold metallo-hydrolase [Glaciecola sp. MF2-115]|uniref:MBL fold metallo-hydrolase n=1 Tax=Glaciecola sp. MF2-115 TaxID=3384827 RepID=UPI00399FC90B
MLRTFHPIGQGAFYTEKHSGFNVVYDCGSMPLTNYSKSVVEAAFSKEDDIDALFISHFDYDHVSAISTLVKSVKSIKTVVLPLLDEEERNLLVNINRLLSLQQLSLLNNPRQLFGPDTRIIYIRPGNVFDDNAQTEQIVNLNDRSPKDLVKEELESRVTLSFGNQNSWVFVPYNFKHTLRQRQLLQKLGNAGFDIDKLRNDPSHTLNQITSRNQRRQLRQIYSQIDGNVNENSMLVYSGPSTGCQTVPFLCILGVYCSYGCKNGVCPSERPGCIYTGDTDLTKLSLIEVYNEFKPYVGTVQLPHHGSKHSFSSSSLTGFKNRLLVPISYGSKNQYGHPAAEVLNILADAGNFPLFINQTPSSKVEHSIFGVVLNE